MWGRGLDPLKRGSLDVAVLENLESIEVIIKQLCPPAQSRPRRYATCVKSPVGCAELDEDLVACFSWPIGAPRRYVGTPAKQPPVVSRPPARYPTVWHRPVVSKTLTQLK